MHDSITRVKSAWESFQTKIRQELEFRGQVEVGYWNQKSIGLKTVQIFLAIAYSDNKF